MVNRDMATEGSLPHILVPRARACAEPSCRSSLASRTPRVIGEMRHEMPNERRLRAKVEQELARCRELTRRKSNVFRKAALAGEGCGLAVGSGLAPDDDVVVGGGAGVGARAST